MVGALRFLSIFLIGLTSAQCPTECSTYKVFDVDELCGPPGDEFRCGGQWKLQFPNPHPRCPQTIGGRSVNVCLYRREEDNKEYCFCDPGRSRYTRLPLSGKSCARVCDSTTEKKTCEFVFILENLKSKTLNRTVLMYNRELPGPPIIVCEGDDVVVGLINNLNNLDLDQDGNSKIPLNSTTLHFHGIRQKQKYSSHYHYSEGGGPWSDGVPLVNQCPIPSCHKKPNLKFCTFTYKFLGIGSNDTPHNNAPAGTYWYHSHVEDQRVNGAAGKLIIMPKKKRSDGYDVGIDEPKNSLFLQEWYRNWYNSDDFPSPSAFGLLVNGKLYKGNDTDVTTHLLVNGKEIQNDDYEVFNVKPGKRYRFRIIGAIGDNYPVRVSIENHTFTAIATDSIDMKVKNWPKVTDIEALWIAAGERYDIVIETKNKSESGKAYKINLFSNIKNTICSLAWLQYQQDKINTIEANCTEMKTEQFNKVLNPVPNKFSEWKDSNKYIYPKYFRALVPAKNVQNSLNSHTISMTDSKFKVFDKTVEMKYPDIPFLFQPTTSDDSKRCGIKCTFTNQYQNETNCPPYPFTDPVNDPWPCEHVIKQPWSDKEGADKPWFEIILINTKSSRTAHPIHHHSGWFNVVGMGQFDDTSDEINHGLIYHRNFDHPVFKDTIQVPTNGYVIFRAPIDNAGAWIVHCHINIHNKNGMAMVFQIGEPTQWSMGPSNETANANKNYTCPSP